MSVGPLYVPAPRATMPANSENAMKRKATPNAKVNPVKHINSVKVLLFGRQRPEPAAAAR